MFADLQDEIADRILATRMFFRAAGRTRQRRALNTAKGLVFVQMYAVYEYTMKGAVRAVINLIKSHGTPVNRIRWTLLALALHPKVTAVIDSGHKEWDKKLGLFQTIDSAVAPVVPDSTFPDDGTHYRATQLRTIWRLFGITKPVVPHGRLHPLIDELVSNRNAIAHGQRTAEDVGRGYSPTDIASKISRTRRLCVHIAQTLQGHCSKPQNYRR
jgi:hypothetical protein